MRWREVHDQASISMQSAQQLLLELASEDMAAFSKCSEEGIYHGGHGVRNFYRTEVLLLLVLVRTFRFSFRSGSTTSMIRTLSTRSMISMM